MARKESLNYNRQFDARTSGARMKKNPSLIVNRYIIQMCGTSIHKVAIFIVISTSETGRKSFFFQQVLKSKNARRKSAPI